MRITQKDLQNVVNRLNTITGNPPTEYTKVGDKYQANPGNYHLDFANGYISLCQMVKTGGQTTIIPPSTTRELYYQIHGFIAGYFAANENIKAAIKQAI